MREEHSYDMLPAYVAQVQCSHCSKLLQLFVHGQLHVKVQLLDPSPEPWGAVSRSGAQAPASGGNVGGGASSPAGAQAPELAQPASAAGTRRTRAGAQASASGGNVGGGASSTTPVEAHVPASDGGDGGASTPAGAQAPELAQPASATGASGWASPASAPDCGNGRSAASQQPLGSDGGAPGRTHVPASDPRADVRRRRRRCLDAR